MRVLLIRKDFKLEWLRWQALGSLRVLLIRKDFKRRHQEKKAARKFESLINTEGFQTTKEFSKIKRSQFCKR